LPRSAAPWAFHSYLDRLGLAGMDDSLRPAWEPAKPIYESGEPERALARSITVAGAARADRPNLHRDDGR
jgi:hypothetical protein